MLLYPNAKINLGLNVIERRPDGYHNLETVFLPIALHDELEILPNSTQTIDFRQTDGFQLDCDDTDNLIVRTCRLFQDKYGIPGVTVRFKKFIPFGAGLGGGSSDAAHTAIALNKLFDLHLTTEQLIADVSRLGADCAFFILNRPCYAEGIGDRLTPIELDLSGYAFALVKPDVHISTKMAYSGIRPMRPEHNLRDLLRRPVNEWKDFVINDFEASVFTQFPVIADIKKQLYTMGAAYVSMTGSGAGVFAFFPNQSYDKNALHQAFADFFIFAE